jgi:hypothetical protein
MIKKLFKNVSEEKSKLREVVELIGRDRIYWDVGFPLQE